MNQNLGIKIRKIRKKHMLNQSQFADKIGISRSSISKWESGLTEPSVDMLRHITKVFKLNIEYFFNDNFEYESENNPWTEVNEFQTEEHKKTTIADLNKRYHKYTIDWIEKRENLFWTLVTLAVISILILISSIIMFIIWRSEILSGDKIFVPIILAISSLVFIVLVISCILIITDKHPIKKRKK